MRPLVISMSILSVAIVGCGPAEPTVSIHKAAEAGNQEEVEANLYHGTDVNALDNERGYTALHYAAGEGHLPVVIFLVENQADLNARVPRTESTPLHFAAMQGHDEVVKFLLEKGADRDAKDSMGKSPRDYAVREGDDKVLAHFPYQGLKGLPITVASLCGEWHGIDKERGQSITLTIPTASSGRHVAQYFSNDGGTVSAGSLNYRVDLDSNTIELPGDGRGRLVKPGELEIGMYHNNSRWKLVLKRQEKDKKSGEPATDK